MTDIKYNQTSTMPAYVGLFRRLFAIFYDGFLLTAILFMVAAIANAFNQGQAIEPGNAFYPVFVFIIFTLSYLYFAWFWIHGGQTLGMKTWQIQLQSISGNKVSWKTTAIRFLCAIFSWSIFGLGFLWALLDKKHRCWHDLISKTIMLDLRNKK
jgi:uncharacterized RDD family membrane protein YckC